MKFHIYSNLEGKFRKLTVIGLFALLRSEHALSKLKLESSVYRTQMNCWLHNLFLAVFI